MVERRREVGRGGEWWDTHTHTYTHTHVSACIEFCWLHARTHTHMECGWRACRLPHAHAHAQDEKDNDSWDDDWGEDTSEDAVAARKAALAGGKDADEQEDKVSGVTRTRARTHTVTSSLAHADVEDGGILITHAHMHTCTHTLTHTRVRADVEDGSQDGQAHGEVSRQEEGLVGRGARRRCW